MSVLEYEYEVASQRLLSIFSVHTSNDKWIIQRCLCIVYFFGFDLTLLFTKGQLCNWPFPGIGPDWIKILAKSIKSFYYQTQSYIKNHQIYPEYLAR